MKRMHFLAAGLAALLASGCGPQKEREPNDHFTVATALRANRLMRGTLSTPRDVDVYRLEISRERALLSAHAGGIRGVDFVLSVQDGGRQELKRVDETGPGGDERVLNVGVARGTYYLALSNNDPTASGPSQEYRLDVRLESESGVEREPNDSMLQATRLLPGEVLRGHYFPSRNLLARDPDQIEEDWFRLDVGPETVVMNLDLSEVPGVDPILEIYDSNAYKIKELDSGVSGEGEALRAFGLKGPASYFLRVRSKERRGGNSEIAYELFAEIAAHRGGTELEPNDRRPDATPFDEGSIRGTINPKGDADWYRVTVGSDAMQLLSAAVGPMAGMDIRLDFCDELGNPLVRPDDGGVERPEILTGVGVRRGTYYLVVYEKTGQKSQPRESYTLTRDILPFQPGLEYEPNDDEKAAQWIKVGESVDGYAAPKGDLDWYQFNVYQKGSLRIDVTGVPNVLLVATLFDQERKELQAAAGERPGEALALHREMGPGTYALRLQTANSEQGNVRDKYTLRLRVQ